MIFLLLFSKLQNFLIFTFTYLQEEDGGGLFLVALAIWLISLFISRKFMLGYVLKEMNKSSDKEASGEPIELEAPEEKAKKQPKFIHLDVQTDRTSAIQQREQYVRKAFVLFRKKYLYGVLASFLYYFFPMIFGKIGGAESEYIIQDQLNFIVGFAILYFLYISLVYYFHRKQYNAENAKFGIRIEHPAITVLRKIVNPQWESYFTFGIILMIASIGFTGITDQDEFGNSIEGVTTIWTTIGYVLAAVLHLWLILKIRKENAKVKNVPLLILRVFGDKKQVLLTFGRLTNFWKHIGSWFTVIDPSFIARKYRTFSLRTLFTLLIVFILAFVIGIYLTPYTTPLIKYLTPTGYASDAKIEEFAVIPGMLVAWFLYFKYWKFIISRSYAKSQEDISNKIGKVMNKPRKADMTFKNLPMFCYANTWKIAVSEFIKNSKVILMDLRGFTSERKGCEYEIDFLLDTFSINGVLFLIDVSSDVELVQKTIKERWEFLRINSPNLKNETPEARIYVSNKQNESEVQAIIDYLIEISQDSL